MKVGEVAARAGVNVETLRYYERRGLLPDPEREPSGHRRYDDETVRFLRAIKEAQAVGFTLSEIDEYLRAAKRSRKPSEALRVRMASKIDEIDLRIAGLQRMREELARVVGCACDSLDRCTCGAAYLARRGRETATPTLLHVTNGESAGNTLRQTGLGGAVMTWQDVLHEGPVQDVPRAKLLRERAAFLSDCGWGSRRAVLSSLERRDGQFLNALRAGAHVVLWFEHDLYDQLQLIDALALARDVGAGPELIVVDSYLGSLPADELASLWPSRRAGTAQALEHASSAWAAFRAPDPRALAEFATRDSAELPFLAPALRRLLEELPAPRDGLSGTERRALQAIKAGAATPIAAFVAAQKLEDAVFNGDAWFFRTLTGLGPLVETTEGVPLPAPPPLSDGNVFARLPIRLTRDGARVLAGKADRADLVPLDRWLGGTHVTSQNPWRWDPAARALMSWRARRWSAAKI
jgi:redox-sensitive transcriptional activator SoxR